MSDRPSGAYQGPRRPGSAPRPSGRSGGYSGPRIDRTVPRPDRSVHAREPIGDPAPIPNTPPELNAAPVPSTGPATAPATPTPPVPAAAEDDDRSGIISRVLLAAMALVGAVLAFTAPWVTADGRASITLSRTARMGGMELGSGGSGGAVFFTIVMVAIAAAALGLATDVETFTGVRVLAGVITVVLVLASWLGRSVWLSADNDGVDLSMGWAYWLTLLLGAAMTVVPARLDRSAH